MGEMRFDPDMPGAFAGATASLDIFSKIITDGYTYWDRLRRGRSCPDRADIDPIIDIPVLAQHIMLLDVRHNPLDFCFRLIGSTVRQNFTSDQTGRWFSEYPAIAEGSAIWQRHRMVAETGQPVLQLPPYIGPHNDFGQVASVVLPLAVPKAGWSQQLMFLDFVRH